MDHLIFDDAAANVSSPACSSLSGLQRVLAVEELLDVIFDFATRDTKARCARVCKSWSNVALDSLWKSMDSVRPALSLLSPMVEEVPGFGEKSRELKFARKVRPKDWARFNVYAARIRHLRLDPRVDEDEMSIVYSSSVLLEVAHKRRTLSLLPNLIDFEVVASLDKSLLDYATLLIGEKLQRLSIYVPRDEALIESFFEELADRVSQLSELRLWLPFELEEAGESLTSFLNMQRELRVVGLSSNAFTSDMARTLSELPRLREVLALSDTDGVSRRVVSSFYPQIQDGAYPSLTTLELLEAAEDVFRFFSSVSQACPTLLELKVDEVYEGIETPLVGDVIFSAQEGDVEVDIINLEILKPLRNLSKLKTFAFSYHRMLHITAEDLEYLVSGWPHLVRLALAHQPTVITDRSLLNLRALPMIAHHCPNLQHLALYVDCIGPIPPPVPIDLALPSTKSSPVRFARLEAIEFGLVPYGRPDDSHHCRVPQQHRLHPSNASRPYYLALEARLAERNARYSFPQVRAALGRSTEVATDYEEHESSRAGADGGCAA
ncbi:hypothetical protein DFH11DRAFT_1730892 [Phellopilus nigrolimitatus]|nr:hypothetical protein DFH11DRAFT_1730892 [Phellopilus nigrolimitatus]